MSFIKAGKLLKTLSPIW